MGTEYSDDVTWALYPKSYTPVVGHCTQNLTHHSLLTAQSLCYDGVTQVRNIELQQSKNTHANTLQNCALPLNNIFMQTTTGNILTGFVGEVQSTIHTCVEKEFKAKENERTTKDEGKTECTFQNKQ